MTIARLCILAADATSQPGGARQQDSPQGGLLGVLPLIVIIIVIMYLFTILPQRKKEKQRRAMLEALAKGDDVVTIGGIHGKVANIKDEEVVLAVNENTKMTFTRGAIARVLKEEETKPKQ